MGLVNDLTLSRGVAAVEVHLLACPSTASLRAPLRMEVSLFCSLHHKGSDASHRRWHFIHKNQIPIIKLLWFPLREIGRDRDHSCTLLQLGFQMRSELYDFF